MSTDSKILEHYNHKPLNIITPSKKVKYLATVNDLCLCWLSGKETFFILNWHLLQISRDFNWSLVPTPSMVYLQTTSPPQQPLCELIKVSSGRRSLIRMVAHPLGDDKCYSPRKPINQMVAHNRKTIYNGRHWEIGGFSLLLKTRQ